MRDPLDPRGDPKDGRVADALRAAPLFRAATRIESGRGGVLGGLDNLRVGELGWEFLHCRSNGRVGEKKDRMPLVPTPPARTITQSNSQQNA
jgi:hypothetical protein